MGAYTIWGSRQFVVLSCSSISWSTIGLHYKHLVQCQSITAVLPFTPCDTVLALQPYVDSRDPSVKIHLSTIRHLLCHIEVSYSIKPQRIPQLIFRCLRKTHHVDVYCDDNAISSAHPEQIINSFAVENGRAFFSMLMQFDCNLIQVLHADVMIFFTKSESS